VAKTEAAPIGAISGGVTLSVVLDTASDNAAAQHMYKRNGFATTRVRPHYYEVDVPDAKDGEPKKRWLDGVSMAKGVFFVASVEEV